MNKTKTILSVIFLITAISILLSPLVIPATVDDLLERIVNLENRVNYLESLHGITPVCIENWSCTEWSGCTINKTQTRTCSDLNNCGNITNKPEEIQNCVYDLCQGIICQDNNRTCFDGFVSVCSNTCSQLNGTCSSCEPSCNGHEDPCLGITCQKSTFTCPDGFIASCDNSCSLGVCSQCNPNCTGHNLTNYTGVIIFQMDDTQCWWLEDISEKIVNMHVKKDIPLVVSVIPYGLTDTWCPLRQKLQVWKNYTKIEIGDHGYDHSTSDSYLGCYSVEDDKMRINRGLQIFLNLGIRPLTYLPTGGAGWSRCGWNNYTMNALKQLGFHTFLTGGLGGILPEIENFSTVIDGVWLCKSDSASGCSTFKSYSELIGKIDQKIKEKGVAIVIFHQQDFQASNQITTYSNYLDQLKSSGKYQFMTAEEYHQSLI